MRRLSLHAAAILATLTSAFLLWELRAVVVTLLLSLAVSAAAEPIVDALVGYRIPRPLALAFVYLAGLGIVGVLVALGAGSILSESRSVADEVALAVQRISVEWRSGNFVQRRIAEQLSGAELSTRFNNASLGSLIGSALGWTLSVFEAVGGGVLVLILSLYWTAHARTFEHRWLSLIPSEHRASARDLWHDLKVGVGDQVRRKLGLTVIAMVALALGFLAMGLNHPTLPALFAGLVRGVPLGGVAAGVLVAAACGAATSTVHGLCAGAYTLSLLFVLRNVVASRLFRGRDYSSFLLVLTAIALVDVSGLVGLDHRSGRGDGHPDRCRALLRCSHSDESDRPRTLGSPRSNHGGEAPTRSFGAARARDREYRRAAV